MNKAALLVKILSFYISVTILSTLVGCAQPQGNNDLISDSPVLYSYSQVTATYAEHIAKAVGNGGLCPIF